MYRIYLRLIIAFLIIPLLSCQLQKRKEPFCITYKVLVRDGYPHTILISYNTPDGLEMFVCSEKEWTKEVCLYPDDIASLFVEDIFDPDSASIFTEEEEAPEEREWEIPPISVQIIHEKKIILATGRKLIRASLLKSETE